MGMFQGGQKVDDKHKAAVIQGAESGHVPEEAEN